MIVFSIINFKIQYTKVIYFPLMGLKITLFPFFVLIKNSGVYISLFEKTIKNYFSVFIFSKTIFI